MSEPIASPCRKICVVDSAAALCAGCGRTLDEIGRWLDMADGERRAIMAALPDRLATLTKFKGQPLDDAPGGS